MSEAQNRSDTTRIKKKKELREFNELINVIVIESEKPSDFCVDERTFRALLRIVK